MLPTAWLQITLSSLCLASILWPQTVHAQPSLPSQSPSPSQTPTVTQTNFDLGFIRSQLSDLEQFPLLLPDSKGTLVGASTQPSSDQISSPNLFWIRDQVDRRYGRNRLVEQWQAYQVVSTPDARPLSYVDVVVNEQLWSLLNYFQRYAFVLQFGTAAKSYGYHLRVFHSGDLANYIDAQDLGRSSRNAAARLVRMRGGHFCRFDPSQLDPVEQVLTVDSAETLPCTIELIEVSGRSIQRNF
ncbi:MAG: hypothetical protein AAFP03_13325 [Cyanobacteria bacterium J06598_3]